ncbi:hypothetical protein [Flavobacterium branchiicola]|uniref:Lipocalin-like domain-containing protein n=1 Tax=Flavobacterium branchiicola TaxID=1114875 RepID=A0ABV9PEB4_9FLAO|nr:hypothetical protein [Flavobacterium branchiicola]MBS7253946.1 hypothetical protein [Flavobacterium branchiicola]
MKKIGLLLLLFVSLASCSNDNSDNKAVANPEYYGKWIRVSDPAANSIAVNSIGPEMYYVFNANKTFVKTIPYSNNTSFSGKFEIVKDATGTHFVLTYPSNNDWISTCTSGILKENLKLNESGKLVDEAGMCDRYATFTKAK